MIARAHVHELSTCVFMAWVGEQWVVPLWRAFRNSKHGYEKNHVFLFFTHKHTHRHTVSQRNGRLFSMLSLPWVLGRVLLCSSREEPSTDSRIALLFFVWAPTVVFLHPTGDSLRRIPAISEQAPDVFSFCSSHCVLADVSNIVLSSRNQPQLSTNLSSVNSDRCYGDNISRKEPSLFSTETLRDSTLICSLIIWLAVSDGGQRMHHTRNSNATTSRWQSPCCS